MNSESFVEYLKTPSRLYQLSYQELKSLVLQYPFCQNLHFLLLQKSQLDQHRDLSKNLELAATYSIDRHFLFNKLKGFELSPSDHSELLVTDEVLELEDLDSLEQKLEKIPLQANEERENERHSDESPLDFSIPTVSFPDEQPEPEEDMIEEDLEEEIHYDQMEGDHSIDQDDPDHPLEKEELPAEQVEELVGEIPVEEENPAPEEDGAIEETGGHPTELLGEVSGEDETEPTILEPAESAVQSGDFEISPDIVYQVATIIPIAQTLTLMEPNKLISPTPSTQFSSWKARYSSNNRLPSSIDKLMANLLKDTLETPSKKKRKTKKIKKKDKVIQIAEQSIVDHYDVASETLAELLAAQEQYERAIKMYKRLCEILPDKSSYFKNKIKNLKNYK